MNDICLDNRWELIEKYKNKLINGTNIEHSPEEMQVLNNIIFRLWQMHWLDRLEDYLNGEVKKVIHARWEQKEHWVPLAWDSSPWSYDEEEYDEKTHSQKELYWHCSNCGYEGSRDIKPSFNFCPNCGAEMDLDEIEAEANKTPIDRVNDAIDEIEMLEDLIEGCQ